MKQTISFDQLCELSWRELNDWQYHVGLDKWCESEEEWNSYVNDTIYDSNVIMKESTIGKIIDYIDTYIEDWSICTDVRFVSASEFEDCYRVSMNIDGVEIESVSNELINALWEALRYVFDNIVDWSEV